ncbi:glycosyltransferase [Variovorax rhizosphaerae]|uniref:Glycosyltransferase n=1 Tax=Variovorax rhizosphaerae TaxID=1836200 RepID=A0ABU8WJY4_9BURK
MPTPSSSPAKPITVSIVSHGQLALILPLLEQLDRHCAAVVEKVVLTINIPEPDLGAGMQWRFPIERIANATPMGFGANHNQAFTHCRSDWFLVLNPDMRFDNDVLAPLIAQAAPDAGLLTPRILEPGKTTPEQHRAIITPLEILTRKRAGYAIPTVPAWVPGLFMLLRSQAYAQVKGFDERFFMYGEDFDICARVRLAGWKLQVGENLLARHEAQRASHASRRHLTWHVSSLLRVWMSSAFWRYRALPPA